MMVTEENSVVDAITYNNQTLMNEFNPEWIKPEL